MQYNTWGSYTHKKNGADWQELVSRLSHQVAEAVFPENKTQMFRLNQSGAIHDMNNLCLLSLLSVLRLILKYIHARWSVGSCHTDQLVWKLSTYVF